MSKTTDWRQAPQEERPLPLRILILKTMLEELHNRTLKLQSTDSSDPLIQTLVRLLPLSQNEMGPRQARDASPTRCSSLTFLGTAFLAEDAHSPGFDQEVPCSSTQSPNPEGHRRGLRESSSCPSMESDVGPDPHLLEGIAGALAPTSQHRALATRSGCVQLRCKGLH